MADLTTTRESTEGHVLFSQLLRHPYEALLMRLHSGLAAAGYADSYPSWGTNVFYCLRDGGLRLVELAERTHKTKQAMGYTVDRLEEAGYVERVPDPNDGRAKVIRLTQRGWEMRRMADEIIAEMEAECCRRLGEERMRQFGQLIKEVTGVLEENKAQD
jgi:DNA-binding MarR family transcriptional regulator